MRVRDTRARLTPVDIVLYGASLVALAFMASPMYAALEGNVGSFSTGQAYLFQIVYPAAILTLIALVLLTGASGGTS